LLTQKPFSIVSLDGDTELLSIPYQDDYSKYRTWGVPQKKVSYRIILAHGTVPGITWTGLDEEGKTAVIDSDLFAFFDADVACLGHIHAGSQKQIDKCLVAYPGSARVWRKGELGPRQVLIGDTAKAPFTLSSLPLRSAGQYRLVQMSVTPDGSLRNSNSEAGAGYSQKDWIDFTVSGVVEDENTVNAALLRCKSANEKKFRHFEVSVNPETFSVLSGLSSHPLAMQFLKKWEENADRYKIEGEGVYNLARIKGLLALKEKLEVLK
jgi:hypothetical protein